jgi:hypothetical protein
MAQKTGSSVENLSRLSKVAKVFGGDMDQVNLALNNLARGMSGVDEESSKTKSALEALGISTKDIATRDTSEVFIEAAKALNQYQDGAAKAALVTDLFKKSGVELLPYLNDVADNVDRFHGASTQAAQDASKFQDSMRMLSMQSGELQKSIAKQVLPAFADFFAALSEVVDEEEKLGSSSAIVDWTEAAVQGATYAADAFDGLRRVIKATSESVAAGIAYLNAGSATGRKAISDAYGQRMDDLLNSQMAGERLRYKIDKARQQREAEAGNTSAANPDKKVLNYTSTSFAADKKAAELEKKLADAAIKTLEDQVNAEKSIFESRNRFLDLYNSENLLSFRDYFDARKNAQEEFVRNTTALYDQEIAALRKVQSTSKDEGNRAEAQAKINDLLQKKIELQRQASEDAVTGLIKEQKAYEDLQRELRAVNADLLELQGKAGEAARIRVGDQYSGLRKRLTAEGDQNGLNTLDQLEKAKIAQADYNQLSEQGTLVSEKLRNAEERAAISQYSGAQTELQTLMQVSAARQQAVKELEQIVINQEAVAKASENPALINQAEAARNALEKLRAESDLLGKKFQTIFVDNMSSALTDFVTGAKSAKDAFKEFADGVVKEITRMAAEAVSMQLYQSLMGGGEGDGNGAGGGMIPGKVTQSGGGGGGGLLGGLVRMGMSYFMGGAGTAASDTALNSSLMSWANGKAAAGTLGSAGPMLTAGDLGDFPGLAGGGPVSANSPYYVGEFGKEVFVPNVDGRIMPRTEFSQGQTNVVNITQNIPKEMSRASAQQMAADTGMQVNRAVRRNT